MRNWFHAWESYDERKAPTIRNQQERPGERRSSEDKTVLALIGTGYSAVLEYFATQSIFCQEGILHRGRSCERTWLIGLCFCLKPKKRNASLFESQDWFTDGPPTSPANSGCPSLSAGVNNCGWQREMIAILEVVIPKRPKETTSGPAGEGLGASLFDEKTKRPSGMHAQPRICLQCAWIGPAGRYCSRRNPPFSLDVGTFSALHSRHLNGAMPFGVLPPTACALRLSLPMPDAATPCARLLNATCCSRRGWSRVRVSWEQGS
jgi:hypothetical protein